MLERSSKIKIGIFFIIAVMALSFFSINWYVILQFRKQLNQQVQTLAKIYHDKVTTEDIDSDYLIKTLLPLIDDLDIPIIITTKQSNGTINYEYLNLNLKPDLNKLECFIISDGDGVNFKTKVWHFPLISTEDAVFITIDKKDAETNIDIYNFDLTEQFNLKYD